MRSFPARFPGTCAHGDHIDVGDLITYDEDDDLVHVECGAVNGMAHDLHERTCPDCYTIHAGECI